MNKWSVFFLVQFFLVNISFSQTVEKIYNPALDGLKQLEKAVAQAKKEHKHVLIQVGGNWCPWCHRFYHFTHDNQELDSIIRQHYILVYLNYSKENKNKPALKELKNPQRFGFPVLCVLDEKGELIHTQDSSFLEEGKSYNLEKVKRFLLLWTPDAVHGVTN